MIRRMLGAARLSGATYEEVKEDRGATLQALLVVIIVSIATVVGQVLAWADTASDVISVLGTSVIIGMIKGVVSWALWALFTWIIGTTILRSRETEADWGQLARGTGFAQTPGVLNVLSPIQAFSLIAFFWTFAAMVVAVHQCLDYDSIWRPFFLILLAAIPVFILNIFVIGLTGGRDEVVILLPFVPG